MSVVADFVSVIKASDILGIVSLAAAILVAANLSLRFLRGKDDELSVGAFELIELNKKVERLSADQNRHKSELGNVKISDEEWGRISDAAIRQAIGQLSEEVLDAIDARNVDKNLAALTQKTFDRMSQQLFSLKRRADFSLTLGMLFAVIGLIILFFSFFSADIVSAPESVLAAIVKYVPRLSLVLIIEAVSFFFLRLYSKAIDELRYTQNEITNIEMKIFGLNQSLKINNDASIKFSLERIAETERNYILKAGETTVDVEKARLLNTLLVSGNEGLFESLFSKKAK